MAWLRVNEREEAVKSLEKTYQFLLEVHENVYNWKWVIIALHNSTQAFMVLALKGTASLNVVEKPEESLDAILHCKTYPKEYLLKFKKLYKYIKSENRMKQNINSKIFSNSEEADDSMDRLNEFRNKFIHFIPCSWSIETILLPDMCRQVLSVIEFLILESGNIRFYNNEESEKARLTELIRSIQEELNKLENEYCAQS